MMGNLLELFLFVCIHALRQDGTPRMCLWGGLEAPLAEDGDWKTPQVGNGDYCPYRNAHGKLGN